MKDNIRLYIKVLVFNSNYRSSVKREVNMTFDLYNLKYRSK